MMIFSRHGLNRRYNASWWLFLGVLAFQHNATMIIQARTILVTGAAGFVGSHLADTLLERGDEVVIVDEVNAYYDVRIKEGNLHMLQTKYGDLVTIYRGDICDTEFLDHVFQSHTFDDIAHMAARAGVRPSILDPFIYVHSNIKATIELLDRAVQYNISNFVFASSSSVYGGSTSTFFSELEQVDRPISPYAATKKSCELFAYAYHQKFGLNVAALRFFTVYGPRGRPDMAVWKFIDRVSSGKVIQQYGNGTSSRDYTYVADIVNGIVRALDRPLGYRIYNLGKGSGTSLKDLLNMIETQIGKKANVEVLPDQPGDVPYTCANISIAFRDLGYNASFPTNVGVAKTVEWYMETYPSASSTSVRRRMLQSQVLSPTAWSDDTEDFPRKRSRRRILKSVERNDDRKTVLVTGGSRFLGSHVVDALLDRGDRVVLVDQIDLTEQSRFNLNLLLQQYGESGRVMVHLGNMTDEGFLRAVFEMEEPQWVCHLAGSVEDNMLFNESITIVEQNIDLTLHLLDLSKGKGHGGFDVENFVMLGSSKVYGNRSNDLELLLDEEDRVDAPLTPYAASKKSEELIAYTYHHLYDIPISILRVDSIFGPRHDLNSRSFDQFHKFLQNVTVSGEEDTDHWIYVGDVVTSLLSALDYRHRYEIFNVGGTNCPQTLYAAFRTMDHLSLGGISAAEGSGPRLPCLSMEKTKQKLRFKPSITLLEGVMETIHWHRELFDYSRISASVQLTNPFTSVTRRSNRINSYAVHYHVPKAKRGWGIIRNIACLQWAIVVVVLLVRSFKQSSRGRRGRSPSPTLER